VAAARSVAGRAKASETERTACPASTLASHKGTRIARASSSTPPSGDFAHRKSKSRSEYGASSRRPNPPVARTAISEAVPCAPGPGESEKRDHDSLHLLGNIFGQRHAGLTSAQTRGGPVAGGVHLRRDPGGRGLQQLSHWGESISVGCKNVDRMNHSRGRFGFQRESSPACE